MSSFIEWPLFPNSMRFQHDILEPEIDDQGTPVEDDIDDDDDEA